VLHDRANTYRLSCAIVAPFWLQEYAACAPATNARICGGWAAGEVLSSQLWLWLLTAAGLASLAGCIAIVAGVR
jgi:hypothetical protein